MATNYTIGIEEEYFLVDAETKMVTEAMPEPFLAAAKAALGQQVMPEFLQSQIEVVTKPHGDLAAAGAELKHLRRTLAAIAAEHDLAILAAGTHPTANWRSSQQTQKERYDNVMHDLQMIGHRDMLCGMHVHVELPNPDDRVDVMYRMLPYLPLFLALSTSSPFWQSRRTGLKGYRLAAYDELPRSGVPELFRTEEEFNAYVSALTRAGVIKDSSYIWWAIRPSLNFPTLELRAPDCCTRLEDTLAIAALYRTLARHLYRNPWRNCELNAISRAIVVENKWRAQRYGVHGTFATESGAVPVGDMLERVLDDVAEDADALGCAAEICRCREIVRSGTSADAQLAVFEANLTGDADADHEEAQDAALRAVTEWIAEATLQ
jgi:glutamate---cysteine ligase / carboxylate-amine ligase